MNDLNKIYRIASMIVSYLHGKITKDDEEELKSWLNESAEHRHLFDQLSDQTQSEDIVKMMFRWNLPQAWNSIQRKAVRRHKLKMVYRAIAVVVVLLIGSTILFQLKSEELGQRIASQYDSVVMPRRSVAKLTVADGTSYELDTVSKPELLPNVIIENGKEIVFKTALAVNSDKPKVVRYHTIEIPRGGEYKIRLSDGTQIYLNSETELRFPENFIASTERKVYLKGEAYFVVAKDESKPFVVKCADYTVKVLGTAFNVSNYPDNDFSHTTLKEGQVEIVRNGILTKLKPGQQAKIDATKMDIWEVNVENYTTWMNEHFRFQSENIEEILKRIARWYDVELFYVNQDVKKFHFSGYLPRYSSIDEVLKLLSLTTKIKFEVKDKLVIVSGE